MGKKLYVGNLSFDTTDADLRGLFEPLGVCESVAVIMDRDTGRSRGFAFVEMGSPGEAEVAVTTLNGSELQGRALTVSEARERTNDKGRSGGYSGPQGH
jgi:cold-inducible RNA-binding protein